MDGEGRFLDNIFIERLWRSLKYEEVFIKAYGSVIEARRGIGGWLTFYNEERPHQALGYRTPRGVFDGAPVDSAAAVTGGGVANRLTGTEEKGVLTYVESGLYFPNTYSLGSGGALETRRDSLLSHPDSCPADGFSRTLRGLCRNCTGIWIGRPRRLF
jgi:hypothetical protein